MLEENGVLHNQIQGVEGYADRFPKYLQDSYDPRNRRIAILVLIKADGKGYYEYESGEPIH